MRSLAGGPDRLSLIAVLYGLSGGLGLVYEVAFNKYLALVFGATAYASSAVLVAFMGGLALGAYLAGRVERRIRRPLLAYALVELTIGAFCMFAPLTFSWLSHVYVAAVAKNPGSLAMLSALRAGLAVVVVLLPACGMGATLPLLARFVQREDPAFARRRLARFYAINTFGGAAGSLISAYAVIPALGLAWTMRTAAALSLAIGVVAFVVGWRAWYAETPGDADEAPDAAELPFTDALVLSAGSGLLVFGCEVVFVHLLALVIGTSVYAFGLMLAIFLVCLSLGTPLATVLARRCGSGAPAIAFATAGLALLASLIVWDRLPGLFIALGPSVRTWTARELTRGLASALALVVPVVAMGTTFPLVLRAARARSVGADVGRLTVANTLGSIVGSIAGGFVVLPALGSQRGLIAIGLAYLGFAWFARRHAAAGHPSRARNHVTGLVAAAMVLAVILPRWNLARLTSGANVYFDEGVVPQGVVESSREDVHGGVTTVVRGADGTRTLLTNGKFQGNDTREVTDNQGFAHLPVVFAKQRQRAMVIGLGTGTSAGTMAAYDFENIDIVELSPAIVDAARDVFGGVNRHVLDDPRVRVILEDGRNVLLTRQQKIDVVSVELTSVWFAGAGNLYNKEFYELVAARLAEGGVLQQWFQLHHTNRRIVAATMASLRSVFPHVLAVVSGHQGLLLASMEPLVVRRDHVADLELLKDVRATLDGAHLIDYVKRVLVDENGIDRFLFETADRASVDLAELISTDDNMFLEYATPKTNVPSADDIPDTIGYLRGYQTRKTIPDHLRP